MRQRLVVCLSSCLFIHDSAYSRHDVNACPLCYFFDSRKRRVAQIWVLALERSSALVTGLKHFGAHVVGFQV